MSKTNSEHAKALSNLGSAKGGKARAERLTAEERQEIARQAAETRWGGDNLPAATHVGKLEIAERTISCAVLENGTRLLTQRDFLLAIGRSAKPAGKNSTAKALQDKDPPPFLVAENLRPFVSDELWRMSLPINFRTTKGGRARGYDARLLPKVCEIYLKARDANLLAEQEGNRILTDDQKRVAATCDLLIRGLAQVGIIALVDEATGYQEERDRDALSKILAAYINEELRPWIKEEFKPVFFQQIYRLHGWTYKPGTVQGPRYIGKLINKLIYDQLPPGVLEALREKNPVTEKGYRRHKHHQYLTENIGLEHLRKHLDQVTLLMRISDTKEAFFEHFYKAFPAPVQQRPLLIVEADKPQDELEIVQSSFAFDTNN